MLGRERGGDRLHGRPHHNGLAVADAPFDAAGAVGGALQRLAIELNGVVRLCARQLAVGEGWPDLHPLDGRDAQKSRPQPCLQPFIPLAERTQPNRHSQRDHLKGAAQGIALLHHLADACAH
ncbi:hypothetical protein SDC9_141866 [bioreactor metagenome]|uniref:Uncharacterized protein n=1 Tax=bioreactor metagenome TaxID=1076179 RepID=A0A645E014_9ZZZZ